MIGADICSDWALHSSFVPHNDLVTSLMNRRFTVNLLGEPIESVSTTASNILPSFHHTTVGFGLPKEKINNYAIRLFEKLIEKLAKEKKSVYPRRPGRSSRGCNLPKRDQPLVSPLVPERHISQVWMVLLEKRRRKKKTRARYACYS